MSHVTLPVTLSTYRPRVDKSMTLSFVTATEVSDEQELMLKRLHQQSGVLYFDDKEEDGHNERINNLKDVKMEFEGKTPSKQLRDVIYLLWKQSDSDKSSEDYYREFMGKIIQYYKGKLK